MKLRYIGETFGPGGLTNGKVYEATEEEIGYFVIDDEEDGAYLYSKTHPAPLDESSPGGRWEIVEK